MTGGPPAADVVEAFQGDPGRPDVWVFDRSRPAFAALAEAGPVSVEERARAARLGDPSARSGLLARRAAVRRMLGLYLGRDPGSVRLVALPGGKPAFLPEGGDRYRLSFSTAHSGDLFCVAVGTASSLGVDVEADRPVRRALEIARRWFGAAEVEHLSAGGDGELTARFLRMWTGKEALAKRHSAGLRLMSRAGGGAGSDELDVLGEEASGRLVTLAPRAGYVASLASSARIADLRVVQAPSLVP